MWMFQVALLLVLMTGPAFSQAPTSSPNLMPGFRLNEGKEYTDDEKARMKANEDAAKAARAKLPDAKPNADPWANARAAETPAKAVKPKAATQ